MRATQAPDDIWLALTKMALRLINDLDAERAPPPPSEIADRALSALRDVRDIERYRSRLQSFVIDIVDDEFTAPQ